MTRRFPYKVSNLPRSRAAQTRVCTGYDESPSEIAHWMTSFKLETALMDYMRQKHNSAQSSKTESPQLPSISLVTETNLIFCASVLIKFLSKSRTKHLQASDWSSSELRCTFSSISRKFLKFSPTRSDTAKFP